MIADGRADVAEDVAADPAVVLARAAEQERRRPRCGRERAAAAGALGARRVLHTGARRQVSGCSWLILNIDGSAWIESGGVVKPGVGQQRKSLSRTERASEEEEQLEHSRSGCARRSSGAARSCA